MSTAGEQLALSNPDGRSAGRREQQRVEIRAALIEAAGELFDEVGYDKATTIAIARRARVAQATLFRHFETKADLALVHLHDVIERVVADIVARPRRETPYQAVVAALRAPGVLDLFTSPDVRAEGQRIGLHQDLAAHMYWMIGGVREQLTEDFTDRLGDAPGSVCPRVLAGVVLECARYALERAIEGSDAAALSVLDAVDQMREMLDRGPVNGGTA